MGSKSQSWLIVGATRGIGLGFVEYLAESRPSDTIYATARDIKGAKELGDIAIRSKGKVTVLQADVLDFASLQKAATDIKKATGNLDNVIINAGVAIGRGAIETMTEKDLNDNLSINVIGAQNAIRATYQLVEGSKADHRTIAFLSTGPASLSMFDKMAPRVTENFGIENFHLGAYVLSKTAVNMLARLWSLKLNKSGIAIPLLHPGSVDTVNTAEFKKREELITPLQSVAELIKVIETADIARTNEGILSYDGSVIPW